MRPDPRSFALRRSITDRTSSERQISTPTLKAGEPCLGLPSSLHFRTSQYATVGKMNEHDFQITQCCPFGRNSNGIFPRHTAVHGDRCSRASQVRHSQNQFGYSPSNIPYLFQSSTKDPPSKVWYSSPQPTETRSQRPRFVLFIVTATS